MRQQLRGARAAPLTAALALLASALCTGSAGRTGEEEMASEDRDLALPAPRLSGEVSVERALVRRRSRRDFAPEPLPLSAVSQLLWAAQGITDPAGLRTAPSAGALYPLDIYLAVGAVSGVRPGLYRYDPHAHRLLLQSEGDPRARVAEAALDQRWLAEAPAILLLTAVYQRTARKYGERATRYVHMEVGHAAQNVYLQAEALGLGTTLVGAFHDEALAHVFRLPEPTKPLALLPIGKPR